MRKIATSLIVLVVLLAIPPPAAWATSSVSGSFNSGWLLNVNTSTGNGSGAWNGLQVQFNGANFLVGAASSNAWTFTATNSLILGTGPASWNSSLGLTLLMLPFNTPFSVSVFQFNNGVLLTGETTQLTWTGSRWTTQNIPTLVPVPEPTTLVLLGLSGLVGGVLRKSLA